MLDTIIKDIENACAGNAIKLDRHLPWLDQFKSTEKFAEGLARLNEPRHAVETTAALFDDQKVVPIASNADGWSALLLSLNRETTSLSTCAGAAVVHVVEALGPLCFHLRPLVGITTLEDIPGTVTLGQADSLPIAAGDTFVVPHGMVAIQLEGTSCGVKLLRFNGPIIEPLTLAFDPNSGHMLAASFSNAGATGRHFFSILLSEIAKSKGTIGCGIFPEGETDDVADLIEHLAVGNVHAFTRWKLVQALARIRPRSALAELEVMANDDLQNLRHYASTAIRKRLEMVV